jgi:AraC-like DNA-binding protein
MDKPPVLMHKSPPLGWAGAYSAAQNQHFPPHEHSDGWEIVLYLTGRPTTTVAGEVFPVSAGHLVLTPPHTTHSEEAITPYANLYVGLNATIDHPWPRRPIIASDAIRSTMHDIVAEMRDSLPGQSEVVSALVIRLDWLLRRHDHTEQRDDPYVQRLESLIHAHYAEPVDVNWLASQIGICPSALRARCVRLGDSPRTRLWNHRLSVARHLIQSTQLSLDSVAARCGFDSASHLSRRYRQAFGSSPGTFRGPK